MYNSEWKKVIYGVKEVEDDEGFKYKYVPKDSLITEDKILPAHLKGIN